MIQLLKSVTHIGWLYFYAICFRIFVVCSHDIRSIRADDGNYDDDDDDDDNDVDDDEFDKDKDDDDNDNSNDVDEFNDKIYDNDDNHGFPYGYDKDDNTTKVITILMILIIAER